MKKVRRLLTLFTAIALTASVALGTAGLTAFAANVQAPAATINGIQTPSTVTVGSKASNYAFGDTANMFIRDPFGVETAYSANYTFTRAGYYTLVMKNGDVKFDVLKFEAVTDGAELVVKNAAAIPSYAKKGTEVTLGATAKVMIDEEEATGYTVTASYFGPGATSWTAIADNKFTPANAGTYTVRYKASNGVITLLEDFTILVQEELEDETKPSLSVSGVPSTANTGVKLTLPKATATDNFDKNVAITVAVKAPNGAKIYEVVDEDASPVVADETKEVVFENDGNMSFYPLVDGKYIVTYTATDDAGKTATYTAGITVSDKKAPDLKIEDEDLIPTTWGLDVTNAAGKVTTGIYIPAATILDNVALADNAKVTVTIKDPNGTVFFDTSDEAKSGANVACVTGSVEAGFYFQPATYEPTEGDKLGSYTITYKARDARNQQRTITKTVLVNATAKDETAPVITFAKNNVKVCYVGDKVPTLTQTIDEANGYKLVKTYKVAGTTYTADEIEDVTLTAGELVYTVTATDVYGNTTTATQTIAIVSKTSGQTVTFNASFANAASTTTGTEFDFGTANISVANASDDLGFEAFVVNPNGQYVANEVTYTKTETAIAIESVKVTPTVAGVYTLVVRAFEQGGVSKVEFFTLNVAGDNTGAPVVKPTSTTTAEVEAGSEYALPSMVAENGTAVYKVIGTRYAVTGRTFVPVNAGDTYTYEVYARNGAQISAPVRTNIFATSKTGLTFKNISDYDLYKAKFDSAAFDAAIAGKTTDSEKEAVYKQYLFMVPQVEVVSKYSDVELSVKVAAPSSKSSATVEVEEINGVFYFKNFFDGTYTVTYTAKSAQSEQTYELTLKSGDITLPTIVVANEPAKSLVQYDTVKFSKVTVTDDVTTSEDKITVTKTLLFNGAVVSTVSGADDVTELTLDKIGTYTIRYQATDEAGNTVTKEFDITVSAEASSKVNTQVISTVLIIVAALLIIGLLVYFFAFRKVDLDKKKR